MLTGVYTPTEGTITFDGKKINGLAPYQVTQKGISRTFQNIRLFKELSVLDNVKVANHSLAKHSMWHRFFVCQVTLKGKWRWNSNPLSS